MVLSKKGTVRMAPRKLKVAKDKFHSASGLHRCKAKWGQSLSGGISMLFMSRSLSLHTSSVDNSGKQRTFAS